MKCANNVHFCIEQGLNLIRKEKYNCNHMFPAENWIKASHPASSLSHSSYYFWRDAHGQNPGATDLSVAV